MQGPKARRSNRERSETTRQALVVAARRLFVENGYAATSTPRIAAAAGMTRGALYHHFADKQDLFRAVVEAESRAVAGEIEAAAPPALDARQALVVGSEAFLEAMRVPGRTRLLLIDGPAVLGAAEIARIDTAHAARTLDEGLRAALGDRPGGAPVSALADLLSATFDRAALAIEGGADRDDVCAAMLLIVGRMLR